jgi:hypothetical protein
VVGLGEAEAAHQLALGQPGEVILLLRLGPEGVDGVHHEGGLHRHGGAVGRVHALFIYEWG